MLWCVCEIRWTDILGRTPLQSDRSTLHHPVKECLSVLSKWRPCTVLFCLCKTAVFYDQVCTPNWKNLLILLCVWLIIFMWHCVKEVVLLSIICLFGLTNNWSLLINIRLHLGFMFLANISKQCSVEFEYGAQSDQQNPTGNFLPSIEPHQAEYEG